MGREMGTWAEAGLSVSRRVWRMAASRPQDIGLVAHNWLEHLPYKREVAGSSPAGSTKGGAHGSRR